MTRRSLVAMALLALAACKEDVAALPDPVEMTETAMGFYCQMELLSHDGPKGQIHLDGMPAPIFFSQVKDALAYIHMPEQSHAVRVVYVQDMGSAASWAEPGAWMPVDQAVYVVGSDMMGGMDAPEFVPFASPEMAEAFIQRHGGSLRPFDQITAADVLTVQLSEAEAGDANDITERLGALAKN